MKRAFLLGLLTGLLWAPLDAVADRRMVYVTTPNTNDGDNTQLTDLVAIIVAWGVCAPDGTIQGQSTGATRVSISIVNTRIGVPITPSGVACAVAYAVNSAGIMSPPSDPLTLEPLPALGKPVTLGQPIQLPPP